MSSATPYSARVRTVELLERGKAQTTDVQIYRDGLQVVPSSATYTILKPDAQPIVQDGVCTISDAGTVTYSHISSQLATTLVLGEGYVQEFSCVISGETFVFRRMAAIVRKRLYPVISDADLEELYSDLANLRPSNITSYQQYIDSAWYTILRKLRNVGAGYEYLVVSPESFAESHRHLSLYLIFRDFHSGLSSDGRYLELAQEHYRLYNDEFNSINFVYDEDHTGQPDDADKRTAGRPTIYLNNPAPYARSRRFSYRR
tara:strand:- start:769 stop:1545 length:777 start_codon:yes stop_codon:yes gene_type:complete